MKNRIRDLLDKNKGFTLLELLVVIGIIGVIMALATVAYSATQLSGRNARKKQDLIAIQNALEQYYSENSFSYPPGNNCKPASFYMRSSWPVKPEDGGDYDGVSSCIANYYCVCGVMEGASGTAGNSGANCDWDGGKTHYCVGNLQ